MSNSGAGTLGFEELRAAVRKIVAGSSGAQEAQARLKEAFGGASMLVTVRDEDHIGVLIQPVPGSKNMHIVCNK